jgi:hypothetical protein
MYRKRHVYLIFESEVVVSMRKPLKLDPMLHGL